MLLSKQVISINTSQQLDTINIQTHKGSNKCKIEFLEGLYQPKKQALMASVKAAMNAPKWANSITMNVDLNKEKWVLLCSKIHQSNRLKIWALDLKMSLKI